MKDLIPATVISAIALVLMVMCQPSYAENQSFSRDQRDIAHIMDLSFTIGEQQARITELEKINEELVEALKIISWEVSQALDPQ